MTKWVMAYEDFSRHVYILGASGSGKTSAIRSIAKGLEEANRTGEFLSAFVYVDPKGDDSYKFLAQVEALDPSKVTFLDPWLTGFSVNLLELPPCAPEEKERVRSIYQGFVLRLIEEWYEATPSSAPRMLRIFDSLISYLYALTDSPTLVDLHHLVLRLQGDESDAVIREVNELLPAEAETLKREMEAIAGLKAEAFDPLLTRLSSFVLDPFLKRIFCVRRSTVDFARFLEPGRITIFRACGDIGQHIAPLVRAMITLKLWFAVQERAARVPEKERTQVVLGLDEFQDIQKLEAIQTILAQARSAGLGLILSHQTAAQLDDQLFKLILGNVGTLAIGRVGPDDAQRLSKLDPTFYREIQQTLATQPDGRFLIRERPAFGEEAYPPFQVPLSKPPEEKHSWEEVQTFIAKMKELYGASVVAKSIFAEKKEGKDAWIRSSVVMPLPLRTPWLVLSALEKGPAGVSKVCELSGLPRDEETSKAIEGLYDQGLIKIVRSDRSGNRTYGLAGEAWKVLPGKTTKDYEPIGGEDAQEIALKARDHYVGHGCFFALGRQDVGRERKVDCVAYDYDQGKAIAVEIESPNHVQTHPEELKSHLLEVEPFDLLDVWIKEESKSKVEELVNQLPQDQRQKIRVFTV